MVVCAGLVCILTLALSPTRYLPSVALALGVLVPVRAIPVPELATVISPPFVVMAIWVLKAAVCNQARQPRRGAVLNVSLLLIVWLVFSTATSVYPVNGLAWGGNMLVMCLLPLIVGVTPDEARILLKTWMILALSLSVFGLVEFAGGYNLFFDRLYSEAKYPLVQKWATYRITTSLGHPLNNAVFFAVSLALALGAWLQARRRALLVVGGLSGLSLVLTGSRSGWIAGLVVAVLAASVLLFTSSVPVMKKLCLCSCLFAAAIAAITSPVVAERANSREALSSAAIRVEVLNVSVKAADSSHWLGEGPGTSAVATEGNSSKDLVIESSFLQLLISVGLPGTVLFLLLLGVELFETLKRRAWVGVLGIVAYLLSIAFFNFLEANRPLLVLLGVLLGLGGFRPEVSQSVIVAEAPVLQDQSVA